ncbi:MAG: lamin tail domain-containing protein [Phycisphaerae bacterium]|nr:lamin tail domain-containing protein [Phycisphaerae bacterium]
MTTRWKLAKATARPGWTLMECLLAMAIMALVFAAAAPLLQKAGACYSEADPRLSIIHEGRIGLATFTRAFRQARMLAQPASTSRTDSSMYFSTDAGAQAFYGLVTSKTPYTVQYGLAGAVGDLAFNCQSLWLTCYSADGTVLGLPGADPTAVRMVDASITVTDPNGRAAPVTFATRARIRRDLPTVVINEIMYKPSGDLGAKDKNQWVELYNPTAQAIDVAGWRLWTKDQSTPDTLVADPLYSSGSTSIPAGGYAVITDTDSELYREKLKNGDFEKGSMSDWSSTNDWTATTEESFSGTYSARYYGTGWNCTYQDFKIDSAATKARVRVWERANADFSTPRVVIRVTNRSSTVYATLYDGPCNEQWTAHTADLTAYINRDARLEIWGYRSNSYTAYVRVDAAIVHWSKNPNLPLDALHLWVNSTVIGKNLEDKQVFLASGNALRDTAVFDAAWGGNGDGTTLSRTGAWAPSTESEAWKPGPYAGTPAAVNP